MSDDPLFVEGTSIGFRVGREFAVFHCPAGQHPTAEAIVRCQFDVVLVDDDESDQVLDLVRDLRAQVERPAVFVISGEPSRWDPMLARGAAAIFARTLGREALVTIVREYVRGRLALPAVSDAGREAALLVAA